MTYNPATLGQGLLIYADKGAIENLRPSVAISPDFSSQAAGKRRTN